MDCNNISKMGCVSASKTKNQDLRTPVAITNTIHLKDLALPTAKVKLLKWRSNLRTIAEARSYLEFSGSLEQFKNAPKQEADDCNSTERKVG